MSIISRLFGSKKKNESDDKPPIYGGDGLSAHSPAIVNCASIEMAQAIMDNFISEHCGSDWKRETECTVADPNNSDKSLKMICVQVPDGNEHRFYFDRSRPISVAMKMIGLRQGQGEER